MKICLVPLLDYTFRTIISSSTLTRIESRLIVYLFDMDGNKDMTELNRAFFK